MTHTERGFSLVELLIVVGIILIIAAIAIPRLQRSKLLANEASATASLKEVRTANMSYYSMYGVGYAGSFAQLGPTHGDCPTPGALCADLLDSLLSGVDPSNPTPIKSGYQFTYFVPSESPTRETPNSSYAATAAPVDPGNSGVSSFCVDNTQFLKDSSGSETSAGGGGCGWSAGGTIGPL